MRAGSPRTQKSDERDARYILDTLLEKRFPSIWVPSMEELDLRQLLKHRHTLVQMRTRVKNQLQHIAMNEGSRRSASCGPRKAWSFCATWNWDLGASAGAMIC